MLTTTQLFHLVIRNRLMVIYRGGMYRRLPRCMGWYVKPYRCITCVLTREVVCYAVILCMSTI